MSTDTDQHLREGSFSRADVEHEVAGMDPGQGDNAPRPIVREPVPTP